MGHKVRKLVEVANVNHPGYREAVDAAKYLDMRQALLQVLPRNGGLTQREMSDAVLPFLSEKLFPRGDKRGWWVKTVQLDLEAKGMVIREHSRPLRWRRA